MQDVENSVRQDGVLLVEEFDGHITDFGGLYQKFGRWSVETVFDLRHQGLRHFRVLRYCGLS